MSTHVPPSGVKASSGPVRDERFQALCYRSPTAALAECSPGLCPWCVVGARHDDLRHTLALLDIRRPTLLDAEDRERWMLAHCRSWLLELAETDEARILKPLPSDASWRAWPPTCFSMFQPADPIRAAGTPAVVPAGTLVPPPPPPVPSTPQTPSEWLAAEVPMAAPAQSWSSSGERTGGSTSVLNPLPLPPLPAGPSMAPSPRDYEMWDVWCVITKCGRPGKSGAARSVCLALSRMEKHGPPQKDFVIDGKSCTVDVVALEQDNPATGNPPRQIRKRPHHEAEM